ncbi:DUF4238 domain-containing protein [Rouxiella sp. T17]|uniref:DUF4238 domain-containing protein n=1 Tax=Rouxiella sp. T17 TaxID=3085684 RepID=UPI002FC95ECA
MSEPRHHHYLSQCYLRGFTSGVGKRARLTVIDPTARTSFETNTRGVGGVRDFNRIDIDGIDPNFIERELAKFEGKAATALRELENGEAFKEDRKNTILELISLLAIRTPAMRENLSKPFLQMAKFEMANGLSDKKQWEEARARAHAEEGTEVDTSITFEQIKELHDAGGLEVSIRREHQIHLEMMGAGMIFELLQQRGWILVKAKHGEGDFITSDNPVVLTWTNPDEMPNFESPGFGRENTLVFFPVTKRLMLVGEYGKGDGVSEISRDTIALFNSRTISNCSERILSSDNNFVFFGKGRVLKKGSSLIN